MILPKQKIPRTRPLKSIRLSTNPQNVGVYLNPHTNFRKNHIQNSFLACFFIHLWRVFSYIQMYEKTGQKAILYVFFSEICMRIDVNPQILRVHTY